MLSNFRKVKAGLRLWNLCHTNPRPSGELEGSFICSMKAYFIRRFLLVPITLLGVTLIVFTLTRIIPGGPIEQALQRANDQGDGGGKASSDGPQGNIDEEGIEKMEERYDYDKSIIRAYFNWLGAMPKEVSKVKQELPVSATAFRSRSNGVLKIGRRGGRILWVKNESGKDLLTEEGWGVELEAPDGTEDGVYLAKVTEPGNDAVIEAKFPSSGEAIGSKVIKDTTLEAELILSGSGRRIVVRVDEQDPTKILSQEFVDGSSSPEDEGWVIEVETPGERSEAAARRYNVPLEKVKTDYDYRVVAYKEKFAGLLQGNLGESVKYQDKVSDMILQRIPIALYFGVLSTLIIYGVCIPLGVVKAIKHRTMMDNVSSIAVFVGYSIPGFAFGALLLVYLGAREGWFPLFGLMSPDAENLSLWGKIKDLAHHTVLPLAAYVVSGFAVMTMMMKNNLMDNLAADYVRTAVAKGVSFKSAVFKHAFRNSFIPIATSLGQLVTLFVGGSLLVERVFDIQGFGLLSFNAIEERDGTVIMGTLTISAFLMMIGNILSDVIVAFVDPRIKFN